MKAYTDYSFYELGDVSHSDAPIREVQVLSYDLDKYCRIKVEGIETEVKRAYLYTRPGRLYEVPAIDTRKCKTTNGKYVWQLEKVRGRKIRYFLELIVDGTPANIEIEFRTKKEVYKYIDAHPGEYDVYQQRKSWGARGSRSISCFVGAYLSNSMFPKYLDYRKAK